MSDNENKNNLTDEEKNEKLEQSISFTKKIFNFIKNHKKIIEKIGFVSIAIIIYCLLCNPTIEEFLTQVLGKTLTDATKFASVCMLIGGE